MLPKTVSRVVALAAARVPRSVSLVFKEIVEVQIVFCNRVLILR